MMESYDEALIKDGSTIRLDGEATVTTKLVNISNCSSGSKMSNKQIFDFGAEISTTNMSKEANDNNNDDVDEEVAVKTNTRKINNKNGNGTAGESKRQEQTNSPQPIGPALPARLKRKCSKDNGIENVTNTPKKVLNESEVGGKDHEEDNDDDDSSQSCINQQNHTPSQGANGEDDDDVEDSDDDDEDEDDDDDDESGSISDSTNYSQYSGTSDMSGREWKPISARPIQWVQKQKHSGADPLELLSQFVPSTASLNALAPNLNENTLWRILASLMSEPPRRQKLSHVNTFEDVISLVLKSKNIIVLTGAGVSVSCGIPDFRSADGIYSRLNKDFPDLPDPQAMFDINYFSRDPRPFFKFAREIYPGQFRPSPCHRFIRLLEQKQKLLRNYTQNIDTLEQVAGIRNVIECHGSFSTASCTKCKYKCDADAIRDDIFAQRIPVCPHCQPHVRRSVDARQDPVPVSELELRQLVLDGIMKPDIVFFGEGLPDEFHTVMASDKDKCDLLIVMGSSLKVRPVALIPSSIPAEVPQILINREQLHHLEFDVELLGDSDVIINQLCHRLAATDDAAWKSICYDEEVMRESKKLLPLFSLDEADDDDGDDERDTDEDETALPDTTLQDNDTLSLKSNASTELALRSSAAGGAYSDSGFESSTSSVAVHGSSAGRSELEAPLTDIKSVDLLQPPDLLASAEVDLNDFGNPPGFHPFAERLGQPAYVAPATDLPNNRHLSVDSSKDSGIQGDASNLANSSESGVGSDTTNTPPALSPPMPAAKSTTKSSVGNTASCSRPVGVENRANLYRSAGERLHNGTYYCHESSASYVFPGAQVAWSSDSEEEMEVGTELAYVSGNTTHTAEEASAEAASFKQAAVTDELSSTNEKTAEIPPTTKPKAAAKKRYSSSLDAEPADATTTSATAASTTSCTITQISNTDVDDDDERRPAVKKRCDNSSTLRAAVASVALSQTHAEDSTSASALLLQQL